MTELLNNGDFEVFTGGAGSPTWAGWVTGAYSGAFSATTEALNGTYAAKWTQGGSSGSSSDVAAYMLNILPTDIIAGTGLTVSFRFNHSIGGTAPKFFLVRRDLSGVDHYFILDDEALPSYADGVANSRPIRQGPGYVPPTHETATPTDYGTFRFRWRYPAATQFCYIYIEFDGMAAGQVVRLDSISVHSLDNDVTAASPAFNDVLDAYYQTAFGGTLHIPMGSGTADWSSNSLLLTDGIIIKGPGLGVGWGSDWGGVTIKCTGRWYHDPYFGWTPFAPIDIHPTSVSANNNERIEITGIDFDRQDITEPSGQVPTATIRVRGGDTVLINPFRNLVVQNNRFRNMPTFSSNIYVESGQFRGVISGNDIDRCDIPFRYIGSTYGWNELASTQIYGNGDTLFFENNHIHWSSYYIGTSPGWIETGRASRLVIRYNNYDFANAWTQSGGGTINRTAIELWDSHGFEDACIGEHRTDAHLTSGSTTVTSATGLFIADDAGFDISGTGIPTGTKIASIVSSTEITLTNSATATTTTGTITWGVIPADRTGTMVWEAYGNLIQNFPGNRIAAFRGTWGLCFNNILSGDGAANHQCWDMLGATPAWQHTPIGTIDPAIETRPNNTYNFNVTWNGAQKRMEKLTPQTADVLCDIDNCRLYPHGDLGVAKGSIPPTNENENWWNYNPAFGDAENGIGAGTSPPVTTGNPDGAGYWVCSTPTPIVTPEIVQTGSLYKRIGGLWVNYYSPFTYPHPLRSSDAPPLITAGNRRKAILARRRGLY